jgi:hypothetical protein
VMNRPFRFEAYLADAAERHITLTRLFMLFRELQSAQNPYSTCKPESPDYVAPFARTGPGLALDGQPRYDLNRPNAEFFERLHRFVAQASDYGVIVEVVLLSNTYAPAVWALNPLHAENNVNDVEAVDWPDYVTQRHARLYARQVAHVQRIVTELNGYDNVIYEICNEPGGDAPGRADNPSVDEVNAWLRALIQVVRDTEATLPCHHLIAGQEAFRYVPWEQPSARTFGDLDYDVVNMHPLPGTTYAGRTYDMGQFMAKQLVLRAVRDYCLAAYAERKPLNLDEDNSASQYKDYDGWTIHRKRAWVTLLSGAHYDYIDFSIINYCETGTPASRRCIRSWIGYLADFVHSFGLARGAPVEDLLRGQPAHTLASVYGVGSEDYAVYLADARELDELGAGDHIRGEVVLALPQGAWRVACYDPQTGLYSPALRVQGGPDVHLDLPDFRHDLVVRATLA